MEQQEEREAEDCKGKGRKAGEFMADEPLLQAFAGC